MKVTTKNDYYLNFKTMKMRILSSTLLLSFLFFVYCSKDNDDTGGTIIIDETPEEDVFIEADPNINDGVITFEETGPSFSEENRQPDDRSQGNWSRFGGVDASNTHLSVAYADNPAKEGINTSDRVIKVTEPVGVQSWAGFYFMLEEKINFPAGREAISFQFYSPEAGHNVLLKLEDELQNDTEGKKSTGDLFAVTEGTGWETLVFNIPEKNGERNGIYNTVTMILGYGVTNSVETVYLIDNFDFAEPKEVVIPDAPTDAPTTPTYSAGEVISIFSDAYTSIDGINLNPNWGQSTAVSTETIADNTVLKYDNLNYQGTEVPNIDVSAKTKLHLDYFTGNATVLKFFLISPDSNGDGAAEEVAYELDLTNLGQWNSVDIDLSHFGSVVDLTNVFQFKVEGNGTVYFDNIFFYGGGSGSGTDNTARFTGAFGGATVADNVYNFPSGVEAWAGFANENAEIYPLAFPYGGKITFNGATAGTDVDINFKFEFNPHPDTEPSFSTSNITISGTEVTQYTVEIAPQAADQTFSSLLLYLVTQDANVTLTDFVVREYDAPRTGTNYSPAYTGAFGGATVVDNVYHFPTGAEAWAGFANENAEIYPLSFPNGGRVTFTGATAGTDVDLNFKFEFKPHPDTEPSFSTSNVTVSGTEATEYSIEIPAQDAANTFSSALLYLVTQDANITLTNFVIVSYE
jgi:hypothetical protein